MIRLRLRTEEKHSSTHQLGATQDSDSPIMPSSSSLNLVIGLLSIALGVQAAAAPLPGLPQKCSMGTDTGDAVKCSRPELDSIQWSATRPDYDLNHAL